MFILLITLNKYKIIREQEKYLNVKNINDNAMFKIIIFYNITSQKGLYLGDIFG